MTTSRLVRPPFSTAPKAARVRKLGTAAVPTTASALLRRKMRRVMDMRTAPGFWLLALGFNPMISRKLLPYLRPRDLSQRLRAKSQELSISSETLAIPTAIRRSCLHRRDGAPLLASPGGLFSFLGRLFFPAGVPLLPAFPGD